MKKIGIACLMFIGMIGLVSCSSEFQYTQEELTQILNYLFDEKFMCKGEMNSFTYECGDQYIKGERDSNVIIHTVGTKESQYTYEDGIVTSFDGELETKTSSTEADFYKEYLDYSISLRFTEYKSIKTSQKDFFYYFNIVCLEDTVGEVYLPNSDDPKPLVLTKMTMKIRFIGTDDIDSAMVEISGYNDSSILTSLTIY